MKEFGKAFGEAAYKVASKMGGTKSQGKCALAVGDALSMVMGEQVAKQYRGNAWTWISKVKTSNLWRFLKQSKDTTNLPAGSLVIWNKQPAHPYGHIEVADGNGHLCSDFIRSDKLALYRNNPDNIIPLLFVPAELQLQNVGDNLPAKVRVIASALNIRKHAGMDAKIVGQYKKGDIVTIWAIETKCTTQWGKNSKGFFCLFNERESFVEHV